MYFRWLPSPPLSSDPPPLQISELQAMASATARPTFSFHHLPIISTPPLHPTKPSKVLHLPMTSLTTTTKLSIAASSLDVTKDDKPLSQPTKQEQVKDTAAAAEEEDEQPIELEEEEEEKLDRRRSEEKFAVLNTGVHECRSCGYLYKESAGDPSYPVPPGLQFEELPEDWRCPTCGAARSFFSSKSVEVAGLAENQQYGLGGNTLTSGQKALLIYGTLLLFFVLFLQ